MYLKYLKYLCFNGKVYLLCIIVLLLYSSVNLLSQVPNDAEIKTALLYNFTKFIDSPKIKSSDTIKIAYYGEDPVMKEQLKKLNSEKMKGKVIAVIKYDQTSDFNKIDILYVFNEYNYDITKIFKLINQTNTLLITDRYDDGQEVMINFVHQKDKVQFEVNNKNIREAGFTISSKLLLLGGTELDVRELYRETEKTLFSERERAQVIEKELNEKKNEVSNLTILLSGLYKQNDSLNKVLDIQILQINRQKRKLDSIQRDLSLLTYEVDMRKSDLARTNSNLAGKNREIENLDIQLNQKQLFIEKANEDLSLLKKDIENKEKTLLAQQDRIAMQKMALYVLIAFFILFAVFIVYIYGSYRAHKRKNYELEKRNLRINHQKEQIQKQADDLVIANQEMEKEKNRAEIALKQLKNAQSQLVAAEKMVSLGQLTSGIAHEINNPINYISSNIEGLKNILDDFKLLINEYDLLVEPIKNEKIIQLKEEMEYEEMVTGFDELTSNIKLGVDRTKEIVNSLRTFARIDDDSFVLTDIHQNIDSAIILMGKQNKARINIVKDYGDIPEIECIPGKMSQVFMNILINAVQAIKNEGEIIITTEKTSKNETEYILISISDDGMGINKEIQDKIFEPFFTTKDVGEGTGLGLSISYSIIKKHNGFIDFKSSPGMGTIFKIYLPVK